MQHYCRHHCCKKHGDLDPRRRRAQELHAAGRAAARSDPRRAHHGFDIDVQFCVDPVDNGALSSCPAGEGHTWGKVSVEAVETGSMYVHADVTAVFPWLTHALLSERRAKRKPHAADGPDERGHRLPRPGRRPAEEEAPGHHRLEPGHRGPDEGPARDGCSLTAGRERVLSSRVASGTFALNERVPRRYPAISRRSPEVVHGRAAALRRDHRRICRRSARPGHPWSQRVQRSDRRSEGQWRRRLGLLARPISSPPVSWTA